MYRTILVPLDGSAFGEQALPVAIGIARRAGATVRLAHVSPLEQSAYINEPMTSRNARDLQAQAAKHAYLERVAQCASPCLGAPALIDLLDGPVAATLCAHAQAHDIDLIVMSTHGRGALAARQRRGCGGTHL